VIMDWDMPMTGNEYSSEPLTVEGYRRILQSPAQVYTAIRIGSIAKPTIEQIFDLYPEHFSKLIRAATKQNVSIDEILDWAADYISWSESEGFTER
jgi:hypothetical protein